jgi:serine protease DegQ
MTMTTRIMNRLLGAVALGLAIAGGNIAADASIRLPAEQMSGMLSLAPLLNQVKAAVVTVTITGRSGREKNSGQGPRRAARTRDLPAERLKVSGSGVIIDAENGLIFTNNHVINGADDIIVTLADGREAPAKRVGSAQSDRASFGR